jgi:hypothetical protein
LIPPKANAAFVAAMEDILAVYARPVDPARPLVCFDEAGKDLKAHPYLGRRHLTVTERRTALDFAYALRDLVDVQYPQAATIVLVLDRLNTHTPAALYAAFPPAEAWRILQKLEWHYTPTHGSWLNMAELEWSVLSRQCLRRRIPDQATLEAELAAWVESRNAEGITVDWQFTTEEARHRLHWLYPHPE